MGTSERGRLLTGSTAVYAICMLCDDEGGELAGDTSARQSQLVD